VFNFKVLVYVDAFSETPTCTLFIWADSVAQAELKAVRLTGSNYVVVDAR
jgi:hypothetical protein